MKTPTSVMDLDATPAEAQGLEKIEAENQRFHEDIEREIAAAKGESESHVFAGTGAGDAQARRIARLDYQQDDFEPDVIDNYPGPRHGSEVQTYNQLVDFCHYRDALARERYEDYDEVVNKWLAPRLHEINAQELREYLMRDDAADIAYEVAKKLEQEFRDRAPSQAEIDSLSGEEFQARLEQWMRDVRRPQDESKKLSLTRRDLRKVNELPPADFAAVLDILKERGE